MRIIEVISDTNIGGAGVLLCERLACKNPLRDSTLVILPRGSALTPRLREIGVRTLELCIQPDTSFCLKDIKRLCEIFRAFRPHIVNTHACFSAKIAAFLCGVQVKICTRHCVFSPTVTERMLSRPASHLCDRFIAVADCVQQQLCDMGVPKSKINVIINGARALPHFSDGKREKLKSELSVAPQATVLIMCARLEEYKGHDCLFRALKILDRQGENAVALIVGDGSNRKKSELMVKKLDIEKNVRFLGFRQNVAPYFNISDININCSRGTETSSLSLSEGMSLGLPSIVSDYGGNPYMVQNGKNGFVFSQDNEKQLAECIRTLIHDRALYMKMSRAALARYSEELDINISTKKTNALYRECLSAKRKGKLKM